MFQILVALSQGERHGYAIMQEIEERTAGAFPRSAPVHSIDQLGS
jgi:DNA-binding PadR family transcriptional regulator